MQGDYGYGNARVRAMKSRLLDARAYGDLLAATSIDMVIEMLVRTAYRETIEATLVKYGGVKCVAEALRLDLARTVGRIKLFFEGRPRALVALLLSRWDMRNLMAVLRGQARGVPAEEILDALVPAGELTEVELREMALQPSIRATADLMFTWHIPYASALGEALRTASGDLADIETRLNRLRYREALARLGHEMNEMLVREMLEAEIDVANLTTLIRLLSLGDRRAKLRARYGSADPMTLLIEDGGLSPRVLSALSAAEDAESMARVLSGTPYGTVLMNRWETYRQSADAAVLERGLEEFVVLKGIRMFHRDPLSIAIPTGYIWAKANEVVNVRLIAQGKALGWDRDSIHKELIWWVRE